jgi:hypothetical protein
MKFYTLFKNRGYDELLSQEGSGREKGRHMTGKYRKVSLNL